MTNPTRYSPNIEYDVASVEDQYAIMEENRNGDYVTFDEYKELQDKFDELVKAILALPT